LGTADDLGKAAVFLASEDSAKSPAPTWSSTAA
jgi:hypothetical protein